MDDIPVIESAIDLSLFATCVAVQVLALHVCADPAAAVAEIVYPVLQAEQSTCPLVSHNSPSVPVDTVLVPSVQEQVLTIHVCAVPAAAVAEIVYPVSHDEQSTWPSVSHSSPPLPDDTVAVPPGQVQVLGFKQSASTEESAIFFVATS